MILSDLRIYPLKSARGFSVPEAMLRMDGLAGDRRFMVVNPDGYFITQRELGLLAQIDATVDAQGALLLQMNGQELTVSFDPSRRMAVRVWQSDVEAALATDAVNEVLTNWLSRPARLVQMDAAARRTASTDWAAADSPMGFADGFQVLITTTASLQDLNRSMLKTGQESVGMDRFRTNIVVDQDEAWAEDLWESIRIGDVILDLVKPCARCVMTTQDQLTGERVGGDPLKGLFDKRLSMDRRVPGPLFGWNAVPRTTGLLQTGEAVTVLKQRAERWPMKQR